MEQHVPQKHRQDKRLIEGVGGWVLVHQNRRQLVIKSAARPENDVVPVAGRQGSAISGWSRLSDNLGLDSGSHDLNRLRLTFNKY